MSRPCNQWAAACVDAAEGRPEEAFERHLESCVGCRTALEELRAGLELIEPEPAPVPGPWLANSIRKAAEERRERPPRRLVVLVPMAAAAGVLAGLFIISGRMSDLPAAHDGPDQAVASAERIEREPLPVDAVDLDLETTHYAWDDEWGVGVDYLLAQANDDDLKRLVESLPP